MHVCMYVCAPIGIISIGPVIVPSFVACTSNKNIHIYIRLFHIICFNLKLNIINSFLFIVEHLIIITVHRNIFI